MFDLVDIQRVRHPKLRKFTYESKSLKMKSRLDFFLVAKNLTRSVKKTEIYPSIAPDHAAIYISLSWEGKTPRGPGLWKFNNTLLKDEYYVAMIRDTYTQARSYYSYLTDKRLFWEMMKMEIRTASISYAKSKAKSTYHREQEIKRQLDHLDVFICNNFFSGHIDQVLQEYDNLKTEFRVRFFGRIRKRICDPRSYGFFDTKETQNPKKDYFVMTRQAGGTQYIYQNDISLVLP